jgi:hypothetical protein
MKTTIQHYLSNPKVRLALRAVVAGLTVIGAKYLGGGTDVHAIVVAGVLAFLEVFTPLNATVGFFKGLSTAEPPQAAPV